MRSSKVKAACGNCANWCGHRATEKGDCQHLIFEIYPAIMGAVDRYGNKITVPFDPHDARYFLSDSLVHGIMNRMLAKGSLGEDEDKIDRVKEDVKWMDDQEVETIKRMGIPYLRTDSSNYCARYINGNKTKV